MDRPIGASEQPNEETQRVIDAHASLKPTPIEKLTPEEARRQPTLADAVKLLMKRDGKDPDEIARQSGVTTRDVTYPGGAGSLPARIYVPTGDSGKARPVVLYFHGGGFVIGSIDSYDASARALAKKADAIVISADYRRAPEQKFPAAHDDAFAAYRWAIDKAREFGGDPHRIAVAGESAGGNLAINVAMAARDRKLPQPTHMLLIYPLAGVDMTTPSYETHADAKPLNKAMMEWFVQHAFARPEDRGDPRVDLIGRANLRNLPDATIIAADLDPLATEGKLLADRLVEAGSAVKYEYFAGATHEFFGLGAVVKDAAKAQDFAASELKAAFDEPATGSADGSAAQPKQ